MKILNTHKIKQKYIFYIIYIIFEYEMFIYSLWKELLISVISRSMLDIIPPVHGH